MLPRCRLPTGAISECGVKPAPIVAGLDVPGHVSPSVFADRVGNSKLTGSTYLRIEGLGVGMVPTSTGQWDSGRPSRLRSMSMPPVRPTDGRMLCRLPRVRSVRPHSPQYHLECDIVYIGGSSFLTAPIPAHRRRLGASFDRLITSTYPIHAAGHRGGKHLQGGMPILAACNRRTSDHALAVYLDHDNTGPPHRYLGQTARARSKPFSTMSTRVELPP